MTEVIEAPTGRGAGSLRPLGPSDLGALLALTDRDPHANLFVRHRAEETGLRPALLGGRVWGWYEGGELVSALHAGANLVPVQATARAVDAFADRLLADGVRCASVVGPRETVVPLWERLRPTWGDARSPRLDQPFLLLDHEPAVAPDPRLRRVMIDELRTLYPASVAMFREEVGVDPEVGGGSGYRARVSQLIARGWSFAIIERGEVLFKTEVGAAAGDVCQLQGVYVHPDHRGRGLAAPALAAVVQLVRADLARDVTLYVNAFNTPARALYDRVGFRQTGTFASVLL